MRHATHWTRPLDALVVGRQSAKEVVAQLIEEIGFAAVDIGFLREGGKRQKPDSPIYNQTLTAKGTKELLRAA